MRLHVTLDDEHSEKLTQMAREAHMPASTLARALLARAIDDAELDDATMTNVLLGIPGVVERVGRAEEQLRRSDGIPLDQL